MTTSYLLRWLSAVVLMLAASPSFAAPAASPPSGSWDGTVSVGGVEIPFRFELSVKGAAASGAFFNGEERVRSSDGHYGDGALSLRFEHYASSLLAQWADGKLAGSYERPGASYVFHAAPHVADAPPGSHPPAIGGQWDIGVKSPKGESAWRFFVRQSGARVAASILRVDGDTGQLEGSYRNGSFLLSHFSGARPLLLELTVRKDGSLDVLENGKTHYTAVKSEVARAQHLPEPADPSRWTSVKDPSQPLRFTGRSLDGKEIRESDPRFRGKVVLVNIMGSWCPNCHDEAPLLAELDRKYRKRGLELVSISFEDAEQLKNPARLRAFVKAYGLEYTVLLGGEPSELAEKLPQAVNLNTWPATFFVGRDGLVRGAHAGFAGKATGAAHEKLKAELTASVEKLLAQKP
jgi:thiol-disulfide isomerase/thioredoxin